MGKLVTRRFQRQTLRSSTRYIPPLFIEINYEKYKKKPSFGKMEVPPTHLRKERFLCTFTIPWTNFTNKSFQRIVFYSEAGDGASSVLSIKGISELFE